MFRENFELEADFLWARLRRVAERHPRLEGLLSRNADARVARLVQSAAFAFASARTRLTDEGQAMARPLVAAALPECLRPRPPLTIIQASPIVRMGDVQGASFVGQADGRPIPFEVVWPVTLAPFALTDVHIDRVHADLQVLRFRLVGDAGAALGAVLPETVRFFVNIDPRGVALDLLHGLRTAVDPILVRPIDAKGRRLPETRLPRDAFAWVRVDTEQPPLVSAPPDRFVSSTLLRDLFAFPESFCFFELQLGRFRGDKIAELEVILPLGSVVEQAATIDDDQLRLFCAPATNQYRAEVETLHSDGSETHRTLVVARRPHAEILHVASLYAQSARDAVRRFKLRSWEAHDAPHTFDPTDVYFQLDQGFLPSEPQTELRVSFLRLDGSAPFSSGTVIDGEVLATDGVLTRHLGLGDIGSPEATNITRVTPSYRAILGRNYAWRMNAYARMPPVRLAERRHLVEFVGLHDIVETADNAARVRRVTIQRSEHRRAHQLTRGILHWGDEFTVDVEARASNRGEAWLLGFCLARALAERNERLRSSRLFLTQDGGAFADYGVRDGGRLPFPLG